MVKIAVNFYTNNCYVIYTPFELVMSDCSIRILYYAVTVLVNQFFNTNISYSNFNKANSAAYMLE